MQFKGVIFDIDGTLLNSMSIWSNLGEIYLKQNSKIAAPNLADKLKDMSMIEAADYLINTYTIAKSTTTVVAEINDILFNYYSQIYQLKKGVDIYLEQLQKLKIPMVIATTNDRYLVEIALKRLKIKQYFSSIFTASELNTNKTESKIYQHCAEYLGLEPSQIVVYEDALYAVNSAKNAGFQVVAIYDEFSRQDTKAIMQIADKYIYSFNELVKI